MYFDYLVDLRIVESTSRTTFIVRVELFTHQLDKLVTIMVTIICASKDDSPWERQLILSNISAKIPNYILILVQLLRASGPSRLI